MQPPPAPANEGLADLVDAFLADMKADNRSPATIRSYRSDLRHFFASYRGPLAEIGTDTVRAYLRSLDELAQTTRARHRVSIGAFLRWCVREGRIASNPVEQLPKFKLPDVQPRTPKVEDVERVLRAIGAERDRLLFTLIADTGLRIAEALAIRLEHIRMVAQEVTVTGKGNRQRTVYLIKVEAFGLLRKFLRSRGWLDKDGEVTAKGLLFRPDERKLRRGQPGQPLDYSTVRRAWSRYCDAAGTDLDIHQLRHAYATRLINQGTPVEVVQKVLGHRNLQTTMRYAHVSDETVRRALGG